MVTNVVTNKAADLIRPTKLSATFVAKVRSPGRYGDGRGGNGLSLLVKTTASGRISRSWTQRLRIYGRPCDVGLGGFPQVSLAEARDKALDNAKAVRQGRDPRVKPVTAPTLEEATELTIEILRPNWKAGSKTEQSLRGIWRRNVPPAISRMPVDRIDTGDVLNFLAPLAIEKPETARKLRVFLSQIFKWAVSQGLRSDVPTDHRIERGLPKRPATQHYPALPPHEVPEAMVRIEESNASPAVKLGFKFLVHTAVRSGEARLATWAEIDLENARWTIPAHRMKSGRVHRVPLTADSIGILLEAQELADGSGLVFPSSKRGKALSDTTISALLRANGVNCVPHGFRQSFRNFCTEEGQDRQLAEMALSHAPGDRTEASYLTTDALEKRRGLMAQWSRHVNPLPPFGLSLGDGTRGLEQESEVALS